MQKLYIKFTCRWLQDVKESLRLVLLSISEGCSFSLSSSPFNQPQWSDFNVWEFRSQVEHKTFQKELKLIKKKIFEKGANSVKLKL